MLGSGQGVPPPGMRCDLVHPSAAWPPLYAAGAAIRKWGRRWQFRDHQSQRPNV